MARSTPAIPVEELLQHSAWVRSLARSLARDEASAEDLVQETWLRALRRPPREGVPAKPWLARVMRNLQLSRQRAAGRRARRETVSAKRGSGTAEAVSEAVERADLQARLVAGVQQLGDHERVVVILRYFEGLPPRKISAQLGIPVETVRKRLQRARARLRDLLSHQLGPAWRDSCLAFAAAGSGLGPLTTTLLMNTSLKITLATTAAGLLAWWAWPEPSIPPAVEVAAERAAAPAADRVAKAAGEEGTAEAAGRTSLEVRAAAVPDAPEWVLEPGWLGWIGQVVDPEGEPVPAAQVLVEIERSSRIIPTDDQGRFFWMKSYGRKRGLFRFTALHPGMIGDRLRPAADAPPTRFELPLRPAGSVPIRVVAERTGAPVAGVELSLSQGRSVGSGITGPDGLAMVPAQEAGAASIEVLPQGPAIGMVVEKEVAPGSGVVLELAVRTYPRRATLRVEDERDGSPVPGLRLYQAIAPSGGRAREEDWQLQEREIEHGRCELEAPPGGPICVAAIAEGYFAAAGTIIGEGEQVIRMRKLPSTEVQVVAQGEPITAPARIRWSMRPIYQFLPKEDWHAGLRVAWAMVPPISGEVLTAPDGTATIPIPHQNTVPELFQLSITGPEGEQRDYGELLFRRMPPEPWLLDCDPGRGTVIFEVQDATGAPVPGAVVDGGPGRIQGRPELFQDEVRWAGESMDRPELLGLQVHGITDEQGRLEVEMLAPSLPYASARWGEQVVHSDRQATAPLMPGERVVVALRATAPVERLSIRGRLVPRAGTWPEGGRTRIEAVPVDPPAEAGRSIETGRLLPGGEFLVEDLLPGRYRIVAAWSATEDRSVEAPAGSSGVLLPVPPVRPLRLEAVEAGTGERIRGADFWVFGPERAPIHLDRGNAEGFLHLGHLAADVESVQVRRAGYRRVERPVTEAELAGVIRVEMEAARSVLVDLRDLAGEPATRIHRLRFTAPPELAGQVAPIAQRGETPDLHAWDEAIFGEYRVQAFDAAGQPLGAEWIVPAGREDYQAVEQQAGW